MGARVIKEPSMERREALDLLEALPVAPLAVAEPLPDPEGEVPLPLAEEEEGEVADGRA